MKKIFFYVNLVLLVVFSSLQIYFKSLDGFTIGSLQILFVYAVVSIFAAAFYFINLRTLKNKKEMWFCSTWFKQEYIEDKAENVKKRLLAYFATSALASLVFLSQLLIEFSFQQLFFSLSALAFVSLVEYIPMESLVHKNVEMNKN